MKFMVLVTMYVATDGALTASGQPANYRNNIVAASKHWPIGDCVELKIHDEWVQYTVLDRGPKQPRHLDVLTSSREDALKWGARRIEARPC